MLLFCSLFLSGRCVVTAFIAHASIDVGVNVIYCTLGIQASYTAVSSCVLEINY